VRASALVLGVLAVAAPAARADQFRHPAGFTFTLPEIGTSWEQQRSGDFVTLSEGGDALPELTIFVFAASTQPGPLPKLDEIKASLEGELAAHDSAIDAALVGIKTVKPFKVLDATPEKVGDAQALVGQATLHGLKAAFAIVQRNGRSLVLVGVPKDGMFDRGISSFRAVVRGLEPLAAGAAGRDVVPNLPQLVGIREVTASSTFKDRHDLYAPWRTLSYEQVDDKTGAGAPHYVPKTAWCEGKPDEGLGETLTVHLAVPTKLDQIRVATGVWLSQRFFDNNNQITALDVTVDGKLTAVKPQAKREWTSITVDRPVSTITMKIVAVRKGKMNDSCLSAIELVRGGEQLIPMIGFDGPAADELPRALAKLQKVLADPARTDLDKLVEFPYSDHNAAYAARGNLKPIKIATWPAMIAACRARDRDEAGNKVDESPNRGCPMPASVDPTDDRPAAIAVPGPGMVEVSFPSHRDAVDVWRLHWNGSAWRLQAIDSVP
jgi:hypothetical protein